jgi:hypothetical protein
MGKQATRRSFVSPWEWVFNQVWDWTHSLHLDALSPGKYAFRSCAPCAPGHEPLTYQLKQVVSNHTEPKPSAPPADGTPRESDAGHFGGTGDGVCECSAIDKREFTRAISLLSRIESAVVELTEKRSRVPKTGRTDRTEFPAPEIVCASSSARAGPREREGVHSVEGYDPNPRLTSNNAIDSKAFSSVCDPWHSVDLPDPCGRFVGKNPWVAGTNRAASHDMRPVPEDGRHASDIVKSFIHRLLDC